MKKQVLMAMACSAMLVTALHGADAPPAEKKEAAPAPKPPATQPASKKPPATQPAKPASTPVMGKIVSHEDTSVTVEQMAQGATNGRTEKVVYTIDDKTKIHLGEVWQTSPHSWTIKAGAAATTADLEEGKMVTLHLKPGTKHAETVLVYWIEMPKVGPAKPPATQPAPAPKEQPAPTN